MNDFQYYAPTKVLFGRDVENRAGEELNAWGASRVLIHYGGGSAVKSGLIGRIKASLDRAGLAHVELGGVVPNPRLSLVREGIDLCRREQIDFLLPVGGGSVIDSAKAIALGLADSSLDVWDLYLGKASAKAAAPLGAVLTIAAAGSETSASSVITDESTGLKKGYGTDLIRPRFAMMDPALTMTLPPYQTAAGVVDILMHTLERYFCATRGNEMTDRIAEQVLRNTMRWGRVCLEAPENYQARSEIMWAGSLSHVGLTGLGSTGGWVCHPIEHELSGMFDVTHGAGLAVVWCQWARYVFERDLDRFVQYAVNVLDCALDPVDRRGTALEGIRRTERYFTSLGMPVTNRELGVGELTQAQMEKMADICTNGGRDTVGAQVPLTRSDVVEVLRMGNKH